MARKTGSLEPARNPKNKHKSAKQSSEDSRSHEKPEQVLRAELQIPQTLIDRYDAKQRVSQNNQRRTFRIELLTLLAVVAYAFIAALQWRSMKQTVQQEVMINRAVVFGNGISTLSINENKIPNKVRVTATNFGKSVALNVILIGHIVARKSDRPTPYDPRCSPRYRTRPPENIPQTAVAPGQQDIKPWESLEDQSLTLAHGITLYVVGCMYYKGLDEKRFYSDFCVTWEGGENFPPCTDPGRNYVK